MFKGLIYFAAVFVVLAGAIGAARAQDPPNLFGPPKEPPPKNIQETMEKMRIARDKKDFDEMVGRGDEVRKIAEDVEHAYELNAKLSPGDLEKLDSVEKLVKKIRTELGGEEDDSDDPEPDSTPSHQPSKLSPG
ncbi:MAG: hypothetical protein JO053_04320, partial [Acidobacteria bacterium]|nr:hypothetical protein [Acidobacteriota bacterium]